ncbi:intradiol ring-cleavage dioxygenase [Maritimibacter sp. DP1N21-5]|uniref:intradiol ring-cleavage dioxygenase n=1 Tax=Maritimibacter sp. DP1N21-5 TaxID=2836867 RepID=UPI001C4840C7|nr:intradiol ring-cleavage dioxygenase [Maritimibacter sp. DP1N21-5]MBV7408406.1 intradiol ring-cleavage dioxygenase [Maritimibacter sp. DP1N21-5]
MSHLSRRQLLASLAASPVVALGIGAYSRAAHAQAAGAGPIAPNVCMVMPETTAGPYYFDPGIVRADITEGLEGVPLTLKLQVVDATCVPLAGARVDVWQCDAEGNYSGYRQNAGGDTSNKTFLRGTQMTDEAGLVTFDSIYPGWYPGRTTHVHYKVFLDETTVLTSQIFFPDTLSDAIYATVAPYDTRGAAHRTMNTDDFIARQIGDGGYAAIREQTGRYTADLVVGVDPGPL